MEEYGKDYITFDEWLTENEIQAIIKYNETHEADCRLLEKLSKLASIEDED